MHTSRGSGWVSKSLMGYWFSEIINQLGADREHIKELAFLMPKPARIKGVCQILKKLAKTKGNC